MPKTYTTSSFTVGVIVESSLGAMFKMKAPPPPEADLAKFNDELARVCNELDQQGYEVHSVIPLQLGATFAHSSNGRLPFTVTRGATVIGKLRRSPS